MSCHPKLSPQAVTLSCHPELSPRAVTLSCHPEPSPQIVTPTPVPTLPAGPLLLHPAPPGSWGLCCPCRRPGGGDAGGAPVLSPHIVPSEHSRVGQEGSSGFSGASTSLRMPWNCIPCTRGARSAALGMAGAAQTPLPGAAMCPNVLPPSAEGLSPLLSGELEQCEIPQQILVGCLAVLLTHPSVSILFIPG